MLVLFKIVLSSNRLQNNNVNVIFVFKRQFITVCSFSLVERGSNAGHTIWYGILP